MAIFRNEGAECQCIDDETNHRIFWMDPEMPGRVYVYLSPDDAIGAADQFSRYGILKEDELPGRLTIASAQCHLSAIWQ